MRQVVLAGTGSLARGQLMTRQLVVTKLIGLDGAEDGGVEELAIGTAHLLALLA